MSDHEVRVTFGRDEKPRTIDQILGFDFTIDLLEMVDPISMDLPFDPELWEAAKPDSEIEVYFDDVKMFRGFIDSRERRLGSASISIQGRDRAGRLEESAPLQRFEGLNFAEFLATQVGEWFEQIVFDNELNRRQLGGRGRKLAKVSGEPIFTGPNAIKKVEPGQSRHQVVTEVLEEIGVLSWSSADGRTFIVGLPNYEQEAQWRFVVGKSGNILEISYRESVADRFSLVTACGAGQGNSSSYGKNVTRKRATVRDGPNDDGTGNDFAFPKRLLIADSDVRSAGAAQDRAIREKAIQDATGKTLDVTVDGWSFDPTDGGKPIIFHPDKIVYLSDPDIDLAEDFYITRVQFTYSEAGQVAELSCVPRGTELRSS